MLLPRIIFSCRAIHLSGNVFSKTSHYDSLGLTPKATQQDVKNAYYKLSMIYHPDKNKGSDEASAKFRDITAAYEVLGNLKLRKLYDKGMLDSHGPGYSEQTDGKDFNDNVKFSKFYHSRIHNPRNPSASGRTPIYNFDEWTKAHYSDTFSRKQGAKKEHDDKFSKNVENTSYLKTELLAFAIIAIIVGLLHAIKMDDQYDIYPTKKATDSGKNI